MIFKAQSFVLYTTLHHTSPNQANSPHQHYYRRHSVQRNIGKSTSYGSSITTTSLWMGAFNRRNKQNDLMKKFDQAKEGRKTHVEPSKQTFENDKSDEVVKDRPKLTRDDAKKVAVGLTDEEMKDRNDRKRFDEILRGNGVGIMDDVTKRSSSAFMTNAQEEAEYTSPYSPDKIYEGDPAPSEPFEHLVRCSMSTGSSDNLTPLGKAGVRRILPWLRSKSNHDSKADYVVVICDPRDKSLDLRRVIREVAAGGGGDGGTLPVDARERIVFISADSPAENKKFTKKFKLGTPENIFSDEKKDWMREYTALGDKKWTMTMFVLSQGKVEKLVRELDADFAIQIIIETVKAI